MYSVRWALFVGGAPEALYRIAQVFADLLPALTGPIMENLPLPVRQGAAIAAAIGVFWRLKRQANLAKAQKKENGDDG